MPLPVRMRVALQASLAGLLVASTGCAQAPAPVAATAPGPAAAATQAAAIASEATPITGSPADHDPLLNAIGDARFVLLGESTHGTHEYYRERARLTHRLIRERGFNAVAIEADWSAAARVNRYVRGLGTDRTAEQALAGFTHFPRWMWRNHDFRDFVEALRTHNLALPPARRVGVYGMDVYDVAEASKAAVTYLRAVRPAEAEGAARAYACFARYRGDMQAYGAATRRPKHSCEKHAGEVLAGMRRLPRPQDPIAAEAWFAAVRSAASVAGGEEFFRTTHSGSLAWNVRDRWMARTVEEIADHAAALSGAPGKVVVWAHNSHSGDARATYAANRGLLNLGQLMRQRHGEAAFLVGLFSHHGTVTAAPEWDAPGRTYDMKAALPGSFADLLHHRGGAPYALVMRGNAEAGKLLGEQRLERAIGVVYQPELERDAHYFDARLSEQFDAILFFDRSTAVRPLVPEPPARPQSGAAILLPS